MSKIWSTVLYDLSAFIRLLIVVYIWALALVIGVPFIMHLIWGQGIIANVISQLEMMSYVAISLNVVLLFYLGFKTYDRFAFLIQNGISRKTGWQAKTIALMISALVATIYSIVINSTSNMSGSNRTFYMMMYGNFFHQSFLNFLMMIIFIFLLMMTVVAGGMLIGSIFALLNRHRQMQLLVAGALLMVILLGLFTRFLDSNLVNYEMIEHFLKFIMGYNEKMGLFNPVVPSGVMLIVIVAGIFISGLLNTKLVIRRGE